MQADIKTLWNKADATGWNAEGEQESEEPTGTMSDGAA